MGKKLIEVALPLEAINAACVEDKDRKTGHIRNLHKWFAPLPLPAWRAVLFASVVDDPSTRLSGDAADRERQRLFDLIARLVKFDAISDREFKGIGVQDQAIRTMTVDTPRRFFDGA